jgi:hypothetical protein
MYLVAIAELGGELSSSRLGSLATDLGTTAYELRLALNAGLPAVVLITDNETQAKTAAATITRHEHIPTICDRNRVLPAGHMTTLRDFELTRSALIADRTSKESCPYDAFTVLLRATHRSQQESVEQIQERQFRPGMALMTGGLVLSKKTTKEVTTTTTTREQVLYLFRRGEEHPWILRERFANYAALGSAMGPSSFENFTKAIAELRKLAQGALYDERLVNSRSIRGLGDGSLATDLLAYLLAHYLIHRTHGANQ